MDLGKHISSHENLATMKRKTKTNKIFVKPTFKWKETALKNEIEDYQASFDKKPSAEAECQIYRNILSHYRKAEYPSKYVSRNQ